MLVLGVNGLALRVTERIARLVPGVVCVATGNGRGQIEPDLGSHLEQLIGLACNPNVAAVLVVGVDDGRTNFVVGRIAAMGKPVQGVSFAEAHEDVLSVQEIGGAILVLDRRPRACRMEISSEVPIAFRRLSDMVRPLSNENGRPRCTSLRPFVRTALK
jgi:altronate dehydratase